MDAPATGQPRNPYASRPAAPLPGPVSDGTCCITCAYALEGLDRNALCPECATPVARSLCDAAISTAGRYCIRCAYALDGLPPDGQCPECGTPIELSLRERTLTNASPEYLRTLRTGLCCILIGLLLTICFSVGVPLMSILLAVLGYAGAGNTMIGPAIFQGANTLVSGLILLGYWKYTAPDPSQIALEATRSARATLRTIVASQAALAATSFLLVLLNSLTTPIVIPGQAAAGFTLVQIIMLIVTIAAEILWIVQFVCMMRYTRWLATRVPDYAMVSSTKTYIWLLPLLYIVGYFCIGLGPLVAWLLSWLLLNRLRRHVTSILKHGHPAHLKRMAPVGM